VEGDPANFNDPTGLYIETPGLEAPDFQVTIGGIAGGIGFGSCVYDPFGRRAFASDWFCLSPVILEPVIFPVEPYPVIISEPVDPPVEAVDSPAGDPVVQPFVLDLMAQADVWRLAQPLCRVHPAVCAASLAVFTGIWAGEQIIHIIEYSEHKKGARGITKGKHQKAQARRGHDRGGEKGDERRRPPRKRPDGWKGPWPPPRVDVP
jgi:hypothetical protein